MAPPRRDRGLGGHGVDRPAGGPGAEDVQGGPLPAGHPDIDHPPVVLGEARGEPCHPLGASRAIDRQPGPGVEVVDAPSPPTGAPSRLIRRDAKPVSGESYGLRSGPGAATRRRRPVSARIRAAKLPAPQTAPIAPGRAAPKARPVAASISARRRRIVRPVA